MAPQLLIEKFQNNELNVKSGALSIWGIPFGKTGDTNYTIESISYEPKQSLLVVKTNYVNVFVWEAINVVEEPPKNEFWPASLVIQKAKKIRLEYIFEKVETYIDFDLSNKKVISNSKFYNKQKITKKDSPALVFM